jgi:hypothetical protein
MRYARYISVDTSAALEVERIASYAKWLIAKGTIRPGSSRPVPSETAFGPLPSRRTDK